MENKKKYLLGGILVGLVAVLVGILFTWRKGIYVDDDYYIKKNDNLFVYNHDRYIERMNEEQFTVHRFHDTHFVTLKREGNNYTYTYEKQEPIKGTWGEQSEDSSVYGTSVNGDFNHNSLDNAICKIAYGEYETHGPFTHIVVGFIVYMLTLLLCVYRYELNRLFEWRYEKPELSYIGDLSIVITSVIIMSLAVAGMLGFHRLLF